MKKSFSNCKIQNVVWTDGLPKLSFEVIDPAGEVHDIKIQNYNVKEQMKELVEGVRGRVFLAFGMADIDIFRKNHETYIIEWSPYEAVYFSFEVSLDEIQKIL